LGVAAGSVPGVVCEIHAPTDRSETNMTTATLSGLMLSSTNPDRLHEWYTTALPPKIDEQQDQYRILGYDGFYLFLDSRDDVGPKTAEPGRVILNFEVDDARATAARIDELGSEWLAPLEDRDGSLFATAIDPDGNYVQVIQLSEEHKRQMTEGQEG
jgi:predicted enzyme related to lactoylglutathione lyase